MTVLGIETSGDTATVALRAGQSLLGARAFPSRMSLCQRLASEIQSALGHLSAGRRLEAIAVSRGPGSFTSLRVGLMTAKALAHRLGLPLVGLPTTEVVAWPCAQDTDAAIGVMLPAWNTAAYLAVYRPEPGGALRELLAPCAVQPAEAIQRLAIVEGALLLVGQAALKHRESIGRALGERVEFAPASMGEPDAAFLTEAALPRISRADPQAAFCLRPLYLVPSQAERVAGIDLGMTGAEDGT